jgi:hypothetical protein
MRARCFVLCALPGALAGCSRPALLSPSSVLTISGITALTPGLTSQLTAKTTDGAVLTAGVHELVARHVARQSNHGGTTSGRYFLQRGCDQVRRDLSPGAFLGQSVRQQHFSRSRRRHVERGAARRPSSRGHAGRLGVEQSGARQRLRLVRGAVPEPPLPPSSTVGGISAARWRTFRARRGAACWFGVTGLWLEHGGSSGP